MTDTTSSTGSATGDAHDLESASQQCDLLADDLTAIDTALDLIDEKIGSAGNATELIEAFLKSKNMPDTAVGGMSAARDMLSAGRIKALIDAIAAAKQGVRDSKEAIDGMNDQATEALQGADGSVVNGR
jgi:prefoldin subunit 5